MNAPGLRTTNKSSDRLAQTKGKHASPSLNSQARLSLSLSQMCCTPLPQETLEEHLRMDISTLSKMTAARASISCGPTCLPHFEMAGRKLSKKRYSKIPGSETEDWGLSSSSKAHLQRDEKLLQHAQMLLGRLSNGIRRQSPDKVTRFRFTIHEDFNHAREETEHQQGVFEMRIELCVAHHKARYAIGIPGFRERGPCALHDIGHAVRIAGHQLQLGQIQQCGAKHKDQPAGVEVPNVHPFVDETKIEAHCVHERIEASTVPGIRQKAIRTLETWRLKERGTPAQRRTQPHNTRQSVTHA